MKACYCRLRRIRQIRKYVDDKAVRSLVHAFVTSRLDYCNSLYANSTLSRGFNEVARLVADAPHCVSSRPLLQRLNWLPVEAQITYNMYFNVSCFNGTARDVRLNCVKSDLMIDCVQRRVRTLYYKRMNVSLAVHFLLMDPHVWNFSPAELRCSPTYSSFCNRLKTFIF